MTRSRKPYLAYGRYGSVGIELVLSILLGWWGGHWLDGKVGGGHGWITAFGFVVGVYAGFRALFKTAAHMQKDIERDERAERERGGYEAPSSIDEVAPKTPGVDHAAQSADVPSPRTGPDDEKPHDDA